MATQPPTSSGALAGLRILDLTDYRAHLCARMFADVGADVIVVDHHKCAAELPVAAALVNPNRLDEGETGIAHGHLAAVGVAFLVAIATVRALRQRGFFQDRAEPDLFALLDLVALGTVADVVPLDANNRILVAQGLKRLRAGRAAPGLNALLRVAGRAPAQASSFDLGFVAGPRLNAAGRLADMSLGIECLIADDEARASGMAQQLDQLNRERRRIEGEMLDEARGILREKFLGADVGITGRGTAGLGSGPGRAADLIQQRPNLGLGVPTVAAKGTDRGELAIFGPPRHGLWIHPEHGSNLCWGQQPGELRCLSTSAHIDDSSPRSLTD